MDARGGGGLGGGYDPYSAAYGMFSDKMGGLGSFLGNLFNNPADAYKKAGNAYRPWMNKAEGALNPFAQAGQQGMGNYQDWLAGMKDPSQFINQLMSGYSESPQAKYLQDTAMRAGQNAASADGTMGSTPFQQQSQLNATNIASGDIQNWLSRVLGINTQYGEGQNNLMGQGFNASMGLANLYQNRGQYEAGLGYGQEAGNQQRNQDMLGGLFQFLF
jgi:hypothetical protein